MNKNIFGIPGLLVIILCSCNANDEKKTGKEKQAAANAIAAIPPVGNPVVFSFAFMGCNRVDHSDKKKSDPQFYSSANVSALNRIFDDVTKQNTIPGIFFLLGDIVLGESDTATLNKELSGWASLYKSKYESKMRNAGIEVVAVPGNHEMLYQYPEVPLKGTTDVWLRHMASFMPATRDTATGEGLDNRCTFSFVQNNIAFIVVNTDSYSNVLPNGGGEGQVPIKWITAKILAYRADATIKQIFVLTHKPYFNFCKPSVTHSGLPDGAALWSAMQSSKVTALLSAHTHNYQRAQPGSNGGPYQVIAGDGGSPLNNADFFGYSEVRVIQNGDVQLITRGYKTGNPYYTDNGSGQFKVVDSTVLTWSKNSQGCFIPTTIPH